jgi:hypothetical protein
VISVRRSADRGFADHGWLKTFHTFSFADYNDPRFTQFSVLRVLNQDRVQAGMGFGAHGHRNMEIISYVIEGVMAHKDSLGTGSQIRPGEVQLMSAGTGVTHSEFNASDEQDLHFLQMWVLPARANTAPRYEQRNFPDEQRRGRLALVVSPDGRDGSLTIGQDVRLYAGSFSFGERDQLKLDNGRTAWLHVARGNVRVNGAELGPGDGAGIEHESALSFEGVDDAELVLFDLP